jgi:hypothetical protein
MTKNILHFIVSLICTKLWKKNIKQLKPSSFSFCGYIQNTYFKLSFNVKFNWRLGGLTEPDQMWVSGAVGTKWPRRSEPRVALKAAKLLPAVRRWFGNSKLFLNTKIIRNIPYNKFAMHYFPEIILTRFGKWLSIMLKKLLDMECICYLSAKKQVYSPGDNINRNHNLLSKYNLLIIR